VIAHGQRMHVLEFLESRADAKRAIDLRVGHGLADLGQLGGKLGKAQVAVGIDEHGQQKRARRTAGPGGAAEGLILGACAQMVWVGRSEVRWPPRISSIFTFSSLDLSSEGKRTPTPCVRL